MLKAFSVPHQLQIRRPILLWRLLLLPATERLTHKCYGNDSIVGPPALAP
jgi:hypothetical protein